MRRAVLSILVICLFSKSYGQSFYDPKTIQTIKITFSQAIWHALPIDEAETSTSNIMAQFVTCMSVAFDMIGAKIQRE